MLRNRLGSVTGMGEGEDSRVVGTGISTVKSHELIPRPLGSRQSACPVLGAWVFYLGCLELSPSIYKIRDIQVVGFYELITSYNLRSAQASTMVLMWSQSCKKVM